MGQIEKLSSGKLLYLVIFSFVFVSSFALSTAKPMYYQKVIIPSDAVTAKDYPPVPILKVEVNMPAVSAQSVFAVDVASGVSLYEKNSDIRLFPASTTKMITALTALDFYDLEDIVRVSGIKVDGQKMGLREGEEISVRDLISGLLIYSANDAAEALAGSFCLPDGQRETDLCGRSAFIRAMNLKADELNLDNSSFVNPSGLDSIGHLTTARDLSRIAMEGMKNPFFRAVVGTKEETVRSQDGKTSHKLTNLNELLGQENGVLGIKTGWTENAKENLVTYITRDGKDIIIVLLGSDDRFGDTKKIIDFIFENYEWRSLNL